MMRRFIARGGGVFGDIEIIPYRAADRNDEKGVAPELRAAARGV